MYNGKVRVFFFVAHLGLDMILLSVGGRPFPENGLFSHTFDFNARHDDHYKQNGYDNNDDHI